MKKRILPWVALALLTLGAGCSGPVADDQDTSEAPLTPSPPFAGDTANNAPFAVDVSIWEGTLAQSEMDCFWTSGVRHVVVGTQVEQVARQQLAMSVARGMTVDAYVYLYWDRDVSAQVEEAFKRVSGFPIGRMWLDVEQAPGSLGSNSLIAAVQRGLDACGNHVGVGCGIYTGPGFWKTYMSDTKSFANVPLWYAQYNYRTSLSDWSKEHFGGWAKPVAKQFAEQPLCGVGVDKDVMQVTGQPAVAVDRTLPPDTMQPPPAPGGLYPIDGTVVVVGDLKIMSATIPRATSYQLAVERWTGSAFVTYYTWTNANAFQKLSLATNAIYRFRARAANTHGWGAWSSWSTFDYGTYSGPRPSSSPNPPPPPNPNPPPAGVPGSLAPDGTTLATTSVTLTFSAVPSATTYEIAIEYGGGSSFQPYVTYSGAATSRTFYPAIHGTTYRWKVRAKVGTAFGDWSAPATFQYK